ncbi:MAG: M56 family metallopeptidase [Pseudomonas sp.]
MSALVNQVAAALLTYVVHTVLLLCGALGLQTRVVRSSARRDLLWKLTAFGALATTALQVLVLQMRTDLQPLTGRWELGSVAVAAQTLPGASPSTPVIGPAPPKHAVVTPSPERPVAERFELSWQVVVVAVWLAGAFVSLVLLLRRTRRARRRFARREPLRAVALLESLDGLAARSRIRDVRLTRCGGVFSPVALGRREICLPAGLLPALNAGQLESILAHELAHLERRDPIWLMAFAWLEAIFFFQPLNRVARNRFQQAAERLCDQQALASTNSPIALAKSLANVARWLHNEALPLPYACMAESRSALLDRVQRVLAGVREPVRVSPTLRVSALTSLLAFAFAAPVVTSAHRPVLNAELERIADSRLALNERIATLAHAAQRGLDPATLIGWYDRVPDRAMRVELIDWLAERQNVVTREKLRQIVRTARVWEEQQAALQALAGSSDPSARAFAREYLSKAASKNQHVPPDALAPDLAVRVANTRAGVAHLTYPARAKVCGSGIDIDGAGMFALLPSERLQSAGKGMATLYSFDRDDFSRLEINPDPSWMRNCRNGPVHVLLHVDNGRITNLRIAVGEPLEGTSIDTELGMVPGAQAADYLHGLAAQAGESVASKAILAAELAGGDGGDPGQQASNTRIAPLSDVGLELATGVIIDERQPFETRKKAIAWADQRGLQSDHLASLYSLIKDREVKRVLLRFLAERDQEPVSRRLIDIARNDADPDMRQSARESLRAHRNPVARAFR